MGDYVSIMTLRRLLFAVLGFSMIRVTLPGSDQVCAKHESASIEGGSHSSSDRMPPRHNHRFPAGERDQRPCDTPSQADCCRALASCAVSVALAEDTRVAEFSIAASQQHINSADLLLSRVAAPDPPPPKA